MSDSLLTAKQVANILNIKISTVYALCQRGELVHVRIGHARRRPLIRFRQTDLDRLLLERTVPAPGGR